jgi:hypothetical protein
MPWFKLKSGYGENFNVRGTVFLVGSPLLVCDEGLASKCRALGYFDEVEPATIEPETKASPSLFDPPSVAESDPVLAHPDETPIEVYGRLFTNTDVSVRGTPDYKKKRRR